MMFACRLILLLGVLAPICHGAEKKEVFRPNILFVLVDDMGWRDAGFAGSEFYETPAMDALAKAGTRFSHAYAAHPRCVPSRYAIMTGKFPARAGVPGRGEKLENEEVTIAEALRDAGYATFFAGKWHLGGQEDQLPQAQGFDVNIAGGAAGATTSHFFPYNQKRESNKGHEAEAPITGLDEGVEGEYLADRLTDETIRFIRRHHGEKPGQPFFVYLSHYGVHTPLEAKADRVAYYRGKINASAEPGEQEVALRDGETKLQQDNPVYAAMIESIDQSLARVVLLLDELGLRENTIVVFTSDHGGLSNRGEGNNRPLATSNLPLRAGKGHCYEGGIRVPMIVAGPTIPAGVVSPAVVINTDHFPAFLELAGAEPRPEQHLDGISYVSALRGQTVSDVQRAFFWHSPRARQKNTGDSACSVIRIGSFKLFDFYRDGRVELYDLSADEPESHNLADKRPEEAGLLLQQLTDWKSGIAAIE